MAEKKETKATSQKEYVEFRVPRKGKETTLFVGVNFKNYLLKRGEYVRVPKEVYDVIRNSELAEEFADVFVTTKENAYKAKSANPISM